MIINQYIVAILRKFLYLQKRFMKNSTPRKLPLLLLLNALGKFITERKYLMNIFNLREAKISLEEIIKFINCETNNKSPGNDGLIAEF